MVIGGLQIFRDLPCDSTGGRAHFRKRIGKGFDKIFQVSVGVHGKKALKDAVNIDTTVQKKAITYPIDAKLAKHYAIQQRRI